MSMQSLFGTDPELEKNGVVVDYGDYRITIARAGGANKRYSTVLEAKAKPYKRAVQAEVLPDEIADRILLETFAETVILNWETLEGEEWKQGILFDDSGLVPFNVENVMAALKAVPDQWQDIKVCANKFSLFKRAIREATLKN